MTRDVFNLEPLRKPQLHPDVAAAAAVEASGCFTEDENVVS